MMESTTPSGKATSAASSSAVPANPAGAVAEAAVPITSASASASALKQPKPINPAFRYLGIPPSVLAWRPKRPSRNTSIFLFISLSTASLYYYDRRECKRLKQEYMEKVRHLGRERAEGRSGADWAPRKVNVYGARVPEDVDVDRGAQWFKKYVKPILIAAAIDYKITNGVTPGALGRQVAQEIQDRRVIEAAQAKDGFVEPEIPPGIPGYRETHERRNALSGGTLLLGRGALKEYLWALKRGYSLPVPLDGLDAEERLAKELADEAVFVEPERPRSTEVSTDDGPLVVDEDLPVGLRGVEEELAREGGADHNKDSTDAPISTPTPLASPKRSWMSSLFGSRPPSPVLPSPPVSALVSADAASEPPPTLPAATSIPPQPPLLLVPFDHPIGIKWWPLKLYGFFRHRDRVQAGGEVALALVAGETRPFVGPPVTSGEGLNPFVERQSSSTGHAAALKPEHVPIRGPTGSPDLDFLFNSENHIRTSYASLPPTLAKARDDYLSMIPAQLATARSLARGEREPTKEEIKYPPKTEVELREERVKKEKKWRDDEAGWQVVRKGSGICWDEMMGREGVLRVYVSGDKVKELKECQPEVAKPEAEE